MAGLYYCERCSFCCREWKKFVRHSFETHSSELNFQFQCRIDGCPRQFRRFSGWHSHVSRKHPASEPHPSPVPESSSHSPSTPDVLSSMETEEEPSQCPATQSTTDELPSMETEEELLPSRASLSASPGTDECAAKVAIRSDYKASRSAALFLLSMKEKYRLTQTCIDFAVSQVQEMITIVAEDLKHSIELSIQEQLSEKEVALPDLAHCFKDINPFQSLETEYLQNKFYKDHFGLVVSLVNSY